MIRIFKFWIYPTALRVPLLSILIRLSTEIWGFHSIAYCLLSGLMGRSFLMQENTRF